MGFEKALKYRSFTFALAIVVIAETVIDRRRAVLGTEK
jgi:hypothetical protein